MKKESVNVSIKNIANIENLKWRSMAIYYLYNVAQNIIKIQSAKNKIYLAGFSFIISFLIYFWGNLSGKLYFINLTALITFGIIVLANIKAYYNSVECREFSYNWLETILKNPAPNKSDEEVLAEIEELLNSDDDEDNCEFYP